jgi:cephalosporin hydroxylase
MLLTLDTDTQTLAVDAGGQSESVPLYSERAFELLSEQWIKVGWSLKYTYTFTWLGRPVIQLPEDMVRIQEVIYRVKPDVIVETGVAHGGSLVFYAGLCRAMGRGRVIGVDIEIRPHNRAAIEAHELAPLIGLIEGSSTAPDVVQRVRSSIQPGETVFVVLDSCHTKAHVRAELDAYGDLVAPGSYIVVTDGIMRMLGDVPRGKAEWRWDNPCAAAEEFVAAHPEFEVEDVAPAFSESPLSGAVVSHWPRAYLRRKLA